MKELKIAGIALMSVTGIAIISFIVFLAIMLYSAETFKPQLENPKFLIKEEPLNKTMKLAIKSGENYIYKIGMGNESVNISFNVIEAGSCTIIVFSEAGTSACVNNEGNDANGLNSSFNESSIILIRPWMLAVEPGWRWNISAHMFFDSFDKEVAATNYTFVRKEYFKGRESYVVHIQASDGSEAVDWVDAEKRVLLKEIAPDYTVEMVKGLEFE